MTMPNTTSKNTELITDFLNTDAINPKSLQSPADILDLPVMVFNFFDAQEREILSWVLEIEKVKDFLKLNAKTPLKNLSLSKDQRREVDNISKLFEDRIKKAITITTIASKFKTNEPHTIQKVIVAGLDNAGKTAIMSNFGKKLGMNNLALLKPTHEVDRREIDSKGVKIVLWDFGGQEDYRNKYLATPNSYFIDTDLLIYVIDVQDPIRYSESIEYFSKIMDALAELQIDPYILVFIHKFDPEIQHEKDIVLNVELLKDLIHSTLEDKMSYEIYLTSIFSMVSKEPEFAKTIKDCLARESIMLNDPSREKMNDIEYIMEKILEGVIELGNRVRRLEDITDGTETTPLYTSPPTESFNTSGTKEVKQQIMEELNELFMEVEFKKE